MSENYQHLLIDRVGTDGRVGRITFNRPELLNALAPLTVGEFDHALRDMEADSTVRVIIVRGAGRAFSVGHDLSADLSVDPTDPKRRFARRDDKNRPLTFNLGVQLSKVADIQMNFWRIAKVTIAQAHGYCLAGGMEFAMMADLVTASEDCVLGHPGHRSIGVARNGMILPLVLGMRKAKELYFTGDGVSGKVAEEIGLINYAWPESELEDKTIALADRIANQSADFLGVLKASANRFYENMGIGASVQAATHFDATAQNTESFYKFQEVFRRDGLKAALRFRDGPYGDYGSKP